MLRGGREQGGEEGGKGWVAVSFKTDQNNVFIRISPAKLVYFDPDSDISGELSITLGRRDWGDGYLAMDRLRNAVIFCPEYSQQNRRACHEISFLVGLIFHKSL